MSKHKSHNKEKKKDGQLVIRVDKAERDAFVKLCDRLDTSAAREVRRFMRELVAKHAGKDPVAEGVTENVVIPDTPSNEAVENDATPAEIDAQAESRAAVSKMPKKRQKSAPKS